MIWEQIKGLKPEAFKRLCGARPETFAEMATVIRQHETRKCKAGRPAKLSVEDLLLLTLSYWREYRTFFSVPVRFRPGSV